LAQSPSFKTDAGQEFDCCGFIDIIDGNTKEQLPSALEANEFAYTGSAFDWKTIRSIPAE